MYIYILTFESQPSLVTLRGGGAHRERPHQVLPLGQPLDLWPRSAWRTRIYRFRAALARSSYRKEADL